MTRATAAPPPAFADLEASTRSSVLADLAEGLSEDSIYARQIGTAAKLARRLGYGEEDIEFVSGLARRTVAKILAECRAADMGLRLF